MNNASKGQGSLEYLLIVGGAIAVAAMVIYLVLSSSATGTESTEEQKRREVIASECSSACSNYNYCSYVSLWTDQETCENDCKVQGYDDENINVTECRWDCTKRLSDTTPPKCNNTTILAPSTNSGRWVNK